MSRKRNQFSQADKEFSWWHYSASREVFQRCLLLWQSCFALTYEEPQARGFVNCQETDHLTALLRHPLDSEKDPEGKCIQTLAGSRAWHSFTPPLTEVSAIN